FSNDNLQNQGFVLGKQAVGLQFHLEPEEDNLKEIVVNDAQYISGSVFQQTAEQIISAPISPANEAAMFSILDYLA
ncbi:MAG: type 1 glutamine amidotransferase, partial [Bombilactobacillus sp.]